MDTKVKYVVCGVDEAGFGWRSAAHLDTPQDAVEKAEWYAEHNNEVDVWVEKQTTQTEIVWSLSKPHLPETALIPA